MASGWCWMVMNLQDSCSNHHPTTTRGFLRTVNWNLNGAEFANATEQFFRYTWDFSTEVEQILLMLIALSNLEGRLNRRRQYKLDDLDLIFSQKELELRDLEER